jgi:hypothetical protein
MHVVALFRFEFVIGFVSRNRVIRSPEEKTTWIEANFSFAV